MRRFGKILFTIVSVICIAAILILALLAAPMLAKYYPVASDSGMTPCYPAGSITYYKDTEFNNISTGDFITYFSAGENKYLTRRVVSVEKGEMEFTVNSKSDATGEASSVSFTLVKGKTISRYIPYLAYYTQFVRAYPAVLAAAAIIIILKIIFIIISKNKRSSYEDILLNSLPLEQENDNITSIDSYKAPVITREPLTSPPEGDGIMPTNEEKTEPPLSDKYEGTTDKTDEKPVFSDEFRPMYTPPVPDKKPKRETTQYTLKHRK